MNLIHFWNKKEKNLETWREGWKGTLLIQQGRIVHQKKQLDLVWEK